MVVSLAYKPVVGRRPFVTSPYIVGEDTWLRPVTPSRCPAAGHGRCGTLHIERWRERVHGPDFPICCMVCQDHGISFTVYPPGWVPYGRRPVFSFDHRGRIVTPGDGENRWRDTAFSAVVDADAGDLWPEEVELGPAAADLDAAARPSCSKTQRRHLTGAMRLFALDAAGTSRDRDQVARALGVDLMALETASRRIRDGPGLRVRGVEGAGVLSQLPAVVATAAGLLALGVSRGFWGPPLS